jgi:TonB family protein
MNKQAIAIFIGLVLAAAPQTQAQRHSEIPAPHRTIGPPKQLTPDEQLGPWFADCQRRIHRLLEKTKLEPFSCTFNFDSDGQICSLKITKSSGSDTFDHAVLNAIKIARLRPPPNDSRLAFVQARGLELKIIGEPYLKVQVRLGPEK